MDIAVVVAVSAELPTVEYWLQRLIGLDCGHNGVNKVLNPHWDDHFVVRNLKHFEIHDKS